MGWFSRRRRDQPVDPQRDIDQRAAAAAAVQGPFRMTIVDLFSIRGHGLIATGRVDSGRLAVGDFVSVTRHGTAVGTVKVTRIEKFRKKTSTADAGDDVGLLLDGLTKEQVSQGDVLVGR